MHAKKSLDIRYTDMIVSAVLPRQIISQYPPRQSNPFLIRQLQPLCPLFSSPAFCFQSFAASFSETPGVGVPPHIRASLRFRRHMRHVAPLYPVTSVDCAYFLSPRGCTYPPTGHPLRVSDSPRLRQTQFAACPPWRALCFHILTNCFSRNLFLFTTIHIAGGWGGFPFSFKLGRRCSSPCAGRKTVPRSAPLPRLRPTRPSPLQAAARALSAPTENHQ